MINEIATVDTLNLALDQIHEGNIESAKDTLISYRDIIQKEIDEFDKWAKVQSDIHTQLELEAEGK